MIRWLRERWLRWWVKIRKRIRWECMGCESFGSVLVSLSYKPQGPPEAEGWPDCPVCARSEWHDPSGVEVLG